MKQNGVGSTGRASRLSFYNEKKGKLNSQAKARQKAFPSFKTSKIGLGNPGAIVSSTTSLIRNKSKREAKKNSPKKQAS